MQQEEILPNDTTNGTIDTQTFTEDQKSALIKKDVNGMKKCQVKQLLFIIQRNWGRLKSIVPPNVYYSRAKKSDAIDVILRNHTLLLDFIKQLCVDSRGKKKSTLPTSNPLCTDVTHVHFEDIDLQDVMKVKLLLRTEEKIQLYGSGIIRMGIAINSQFYPTIDANEFYSVEIDGIEEEWNNYQPFYFQEPIVGGTILPWKKKDMVEEKEFISKVNITPPVTIVSFEDTTIAANFFPTVTNQSEEMTAPVDTVNSPHNTPVITVSNDRALTVINVELIELKEELNITKTKLKEAERAYQNLRTFQLRLQEDHISFAKKILQIHEDFDKGKSSSDPAMSMSFCFGNIQFSPTVSETKDLNKGQTRVAIGTLLLIVAPAFGWDFKNNYYYMPGASLLGGSGSNQIVLEETKHINPLIDLIRQKCKSFLNSPPETVKNGLKATLKLFREVKDGKGKVVVPLERSLSESSNRLEERSVSQDSTQVEPTNVPVSSTNKKNKSDRKREKKEKKRKRKEEKRAKKRSKKSREEE